MSDLEMARAKLKAKRDLLVGAARGLATYDATAEDVCEAAVAFTRALYAASRAR